MWLPILYQAVPTQSVFYTRLLTDHTFAPLTVVRFVEGRALFDASPPEPEFIKTMECATGAPEEEAQRLVAEYLAVLERTRLKYPGVERRWTALERDIQVSGRAGGALATTRRQGEEWAYKLRDGNQRVMPGELVTRLRACGEVGLRVANRHLILKGAELLKPFPPSALFANDAGEAPLREEYRRWRQLYLEVAKLPEVIVVAHIWTGKD